MQFCFDPKGTLGNDCTVAVAAWGSYTTCLHLLLLIRDCIHVNSRLYNLILIGLAMLFDIPDERGGAIMDKLWGDTKTCHFPLFPFLQALSMPYMAVVYTIMWLGELSKNILYLNN